MAFGFGFDYWWWSRVFHGFYSSEVGGCCIRMGELDFRRTGTCKVCHQVGRVNCRNVCIFCFDTEK